MLPAMGVLRPFLFALPRGRLYSDARRRLEREGTLQLHTPPRPTPSAYCPARRTPGAPETPEAAGTAGAPQAPGGVPAELQAAALRRAVHAWMLRQARAHFSARLDHFAPLLGVQWQRLALTDARTRWGSAKADGSIRLNWRLLHCAPAVLDYVVVHELAHLRVMDHSPRFWATVASVLPDHAALRRRLREADIPRWEP